MNRAVPVMRAAFERTGSPSWIMQHIQAHQLDRQAGFELQVSYLDDPMRDDPRPDAPLGRQRHATVAALLDGEVDFIDTDWLTVARCRTEGMAISALYPYGRILGGLLLRPGLQLEELAQLAGRTLGVVSSRDKNLTLVSALARVRHGFDLRRGARLRATGSKTTLARQLISGELDAALVYWHQIPSLQRQGCRRLLEVPDILPALGFPALPTTFFVFRDRYAKAQPQAVRGFIRAFNQAVDALASTPSAWQPVIQRLGLEDPLEIRQLQQGWRRRIAEGRDSAALQQLPALFQRLLQSEGAQHLEMERWPSGVFNPDFMQPSPAHDLNRKEEAPSW